MADENDEFDEAFEEELDQILDEEEGEDDSGESSERSDHSSTGLLQSVSWKVIGLALGALATLWFFLQRRTTVRQETSQTSDTQDEGLPTASRLE